MSNRTLLRLLAIAAAAGAALAPIPARWVERFYSNGLYPAIQTRATALSNRVPFSVGDALILAVLAAGAWTLARAMRRAPRGKRGRTMLHWLFGVAAAAAVAYLTFLGLWGLNYERLPLTEKLDYDPGRVTAAAAEVWTRRIVEQLNAEGAAARSRPWPDDAAARAALFAACRETFHALGNRASIVPGWPKRSVLDPYLGASGVEGVTNPFGLEVVLDSELLPVERVFVLAHEWGHLAGFADESEAGFVGWLSCIRASHAAVRYSGWLALYQFLPDSAARRRLPLRPEVAADLAAIAARARRRYRPAIGEAQERIYDRFLKVHRVEEGVASYGLVLRLVLATRLSEDLVPLPRR